MKNKNIIRVIIALVSLSFFFFTYTCAQDVIVLRSDVCSSNEIYCHIQSVDKEKITYYEQASQSGKKESVGYVLVEKISYENGTVRYCNRKKYEDMSLSERMNYNSARMDFLDRRLQGPRNTQY